MSANSQGILLMIASMACFTLADLFLKFASESVTTGQITLVLGIGGTLIFWVMLWHQGEPVFSDHSPYNRRIGGDTVYHSGVDLRQLYRGCHYPANATVIVNFVFIFVSKRAGWCASYCSCFTGFWRCIAYRAARFRRF